MKIRIKGNSIRYRLTKTDIETCLKNGYVQETTQFANHALVYTLQRTHDDKLCASFEHNNITLNMPSSMADEWLTTEKVGFGGYHDSLYLLVEKDFKCLDNVEEDQSDNYPNPNAVK